MCSVILILRKNELQSKKLRKSVWPPSYLNGLMYNTRLCNVCIYEMCWLTFVLYVFYVEKHKRIMVVIHVFVEKNTTRNCHRVNCPETGHLNVRVQMIYSFGAPFNAE